MADSGAISIKGRTVQGRYQSNLAEHFYPVANELLPRETARLMIQKYSHVLPGFDLDVVDELFPPALLGEPRACVRYPCVMRDAPSDKLQLNLLYQDTRIKLAIERRIERGDTQASPESANALIAAYLIVLRTAVTEGCPVWQICTDSDLDAITYALLDCYDPALRRELLKDGLIANERSLDSLRALVQKRRLTLKDFLRYQLHAGTVWWHENGPHVVNVAELVINDFEYFEAELATNPCRLIFLFDDNGELVWDLFMVQELLAANTALTVLGVISTEVVSNNANTQTLAVCLSDPIFHDLAASTRFSLFPERNIRSAIDPAYCSQDLLEALRRADLAFVKGVSFFETTQQLPLTSYYGFVVHSLDSRRCTGFDKGDGIFVREPKDEAGFEYGKTSLKDRYHAFKLDYESKNTRLSVP